MDAGVIGSVRIERHRRELAAGALVRKLAGFTVSMVLMLGVCTAAQAANLYRYINDKGYQEIGYSIPPHLVANGYDVIDDSGRLVRRVAPQLSEEEYAAKLERERELEACEKALESVHRRYEALADIDDAERMFGQQLEERLRNDQANLEFSQGKLAEQREEAAARERKGEAIPKDLLDLIEQTERQIQNLAAQMSARQKNAVVKAKEFEEERRVFQLVDCSSEQLASAR